MNELRFLNPTAEDGYKIWELVKASNGLDDNSLYFYLLMCTHFNTTSLVAHINSQLAGFVIGHRPPQQPDTLFVWQIGVALTVRGQGIGTKLLDQLLFRQEHRPPINFLEASVTPSNTASKRLFTSFAQKGNYDCQQFPFFEEKLFGSVKHEPEHLLRIGPFQEEQQEQHENYQRI